MAPASTIQHNLNNVLGAALLGKRNDLRHYRGDVEAGRVDLYWIGCILTAVVANGVFTVALLDVGTDLLEAYGHVLALEFQVAASCTLLEVGDHVDLQVRIGEHDAGHVATFGDDTAQVTRRLLLSHQSTAYSRYVGVGTDDA